MVVGVTDGFRKNLEIQGVGYRAAMDGKTLVLNVGFSHPVRMAPPDGVSYALDGTDPICRERHRQAGRRRRGGPHPPRSAAEPYKGKGIRYEGEQSSAARPVRLVRRSSRQRRVGRSGRPQPAPASTRHVGAIGE